MRRASVSRLRASASRSMRSRRASLRQAETRVFFQQAVSASWRRFCASALILSASVRAAELLHGLGFRRGDQLDSPVRRFSGGWRMRLNLAQALMCRSDLLLLDEPTNHLDLDAVLWLEDWLKGYPGTLLLISHDRDFLDAWSASSTSSGRKLNDAVHRQLLGLRAQRAEQLAQQQAMYEKQQREIAHLQASSTASAPRPPRRARRRAASRR
jgi:ATPase subunit of ABC transporter with duplicated ATPase domains